MVVGEVQRSLRVDPSQTLGYVAAVYSSLLSEGSENDVEVSACGRVFGVTCGGVILTLA